MLNLESIHEEEEEKSDQEQPTGMKKPTKDKAEAVVGPSTISPQHTRSNTSSKAASDERTLQKRKEAPMEDTNESKHARTSGPAGVSGSSTEFYNLP